MIICRGSEGRCAYGRPNILRRQLRQEGFRRPRHLREKGVQRARPRNIDHRNKVFF